MKLYAIAYETKNGKWKILADAFMDDSGCQWVTWTPSKKLAEEISKNQCRDFIIISRRKA